MTFTRNLNNKYTVSIVTDPSGGDNNPTPSGYNFEYQMLITPNQGEQIIGGDFKIDNIAGVIADGSVGYPNSNAIISPHNVATSYDHLDLRTGALTDVCFTSYVFEANPSFQSKNIDYIILTEEYGVADFPIGFVLQIFMLPSFLNAGPSSVQIDLDIDLVTEVIPGCTDSEALNYNPVATIDDGSCILPIRGCMDDGTNPSFPGRPSNAIPGPANNYDPNANTQATCNYSTLGCTDPNADNYDPNATIDDESCQYRSGPTVIRGCTDPDANNYNANATFDDGSCTYDPVYGCTNPNATNYNPSATVDDGTCKFPPDPPADIQGCMDDGSDPNFTGRPTNWTGPASNYNPNATIHDNSCVYTPIVGCTNPDNPNYNASATQSDSNYCMNTCGKNIKLEISRPGTNDIKVEATFNNYGVSAANVNAYSPTIYSADGLAVASNGGSSYYSSTYVVNYLLIPSDAVNNNKSISDYYNSGLTPNYWNTLKVEFDGGSGYNTLINDNRTDDYFNVASTISTGGPTPPEFSKTFTQFDYGAGLENIKNGTYRFTFIINDGFGSYCYSVKTHIHTSRIFFSEAEQPPPQLTDDDQEGVVEGALGLPPAPEGFHYMPDGSLMSDADHQATFGSQAVIRTSTNLDTSSSESGTSSTSGY